MRYRTAAGKDVVSTISFQLTQKAPKTDYKAFETVLQTINLQTGEVLKWFFNIRNYKYAYL